MKENYLKGTAIFITIFIFSVFLYNFKDTLAIINNCGKDFISGSTAEDLITSFDSSFKSQLTENRIWINVYGGIQKNLGKREIKNFSILCSNEGSLYTKTSRMGEERANQAIDDIKRIYSKTLEENGEFLFVQMPYKSYSNAAELDGYGRDYTNENQDLIYGKILDSGIPAMDLRDVQEDWEYYKTDHHWTAESAFEAGVFIITSLEDFFELEFANGERYRNRNNYKNRIYPAALFGSAGIQVGEYYAGKDDVVIPVPEFETDLKWEHYVNGEKQTQKEGDFWETFIDEEILNDTQYYNKYNAFLNGGYCENRIYNHLAGNDMKMLLISNSYGRPLVQYLSLYFSETRYLDPQEGRYNGNYLDYIERYNPDVVIVMYDDCINTQ